MISGQLGRGGRVERCQPPPPGGHSARKVTGAAPTAPGRDHVLGFSTGDAAQALWTCVYGTIAGAAVACGPFGLGGVSVGREVLLLSCRSPLIDEQAEQPDAPTGATGECKPLLKINRQARDTGPGAAPDVRHSSKRRASRAAESWPPSDGWTPIVGTSAAAARLRPSGRVNIVLDSSSAVHRAPRMVSKFRQKKDFHEERNCVG